MPDSNSVRSFGSSRVPGREPLSVIRKKNRRKPVFITCSIVAAACLIFAAVLCVNLFFGYKAPVRAAVRSLNSRSMDVSDYYSYSGEWGAASAEYRMQLAKMSEKAFDGSGSEDYASDAKDVLESAYSYYDGRFGEDWKIDVNFSNPCEIKGSELDELSDSWNEYVADINANIAYLEDDSDYDKKDVDKLSKIAASMRDERLTEAYEVKVGVSSDDANGSFMQVVVAKIGGSWIIVSGFNL